MTNEVRVGAPLADAVEPTVDDALPDVEALAFVDTDELAFVLAAVVALVVVDDDVVTPLLQAVRPVDRRRAGTRSHGVRMPQD